MRVRGRDNDRVTKGQERGNQVRRRKRGRESEREKEKARKKKPHDKNAEGARKQRRGW